jgi:hypothetical protein
VELSEIIGPNEEMEHTAKNADFTYEKAFYEASEFRNPECSLTALWAVSTLHHLPTARRAVATAILDAEARRPYHSRDATGS